MRLAGAWRRCGRGRPWTRPGPSFRFGRRQPGVGFPGCKGWGYICAVRMKQAGRQGTSQRRKTGAKAGGSRTGILGGGETGRSVGRVTRQGRTALRDRLAAEGFRLVKRRHGGLRLVGKNASAKDVGGRVSGTLFVPWGGGVARRRRPGVMSGSLEGGEVGPGAGRLPAEGRLRTQRARRRARRRQVRKALGGREAATQRVIRGREEAQARRERRARRLRRGRRAEARGGLYGSEVVVSDEQARWRVPTEVKGVPRGKRGKQVSLLRDRKGSGERLRRESPEGKGWGEAWSRARGASREARPRVFPGVRGEGERGVSLGGAYEPEGLARSVVSGEGGGARPVEVSFPSAGVRSPAGVPGAHPRALFWKTRKVRGKRNLLVRKRRARGGPGPSARVGRDETQRGSPGSAAGPRTPTVVRQEARDTYKRRRLGQRKAQGRSPAERKEQARLPGREEDFRRWVAWREAGWVAGRTLRPRQTRVRGWRRGGRRRGRGPVARKVPRTRKLRAARGRPGRGREQLRWRRQRVGKPRSWLVWGGSPARNKLRRSPLRLAPEVEAKVASQRRRGRRRRRRLRAVDGVATVRSSQGSPARGLRSGRGRVSFGADEGGRQLRGFCPAYQREARLGERGRKRRQRDVKARREGFVRKRTKGGKNKRTTKQNHATA